MVKPQVMSKLDELEQRENEARSGFLQAQRALAQIKKAKLYEAAGFRSFTAYCARRLRFSKSETSRIVMAAPIIEALLKQSPIGDDSPLSALKPSHVRPLHGMAPGRAAAILSEAVKTAPRDKKDRPIVTEKHVLEVTKRRNPTWKTKAEFVAERRAAEKKRPPLEAPDPYADAKRRVPAAIVALALIELTGGDAVRLLGRELFDVARVEAAYRFLGDVLESL